MTRTIALATGATTGTDLFPLNGYGDVTTTSADSLVVDAKRSRLLALTVQAGVATVYHDPDKIDSAATGIAAVLNASGTDPLDCGPNGIELIGNWRIQVSNAAPYLTLVFEVVG